MQTYLFFYDNVLKMLKAMKGNNKKAFRFYAFKVINCKKVLAHNFSQAVVIFIMFPIPFICAFGGWQNENN